MEALRPCPFCAATPFVEGNGGIFRVVCPDGDCYMHASEIWFGTEEEARNAWNTRMMPDGMDKVFRKSDAVEAFCAAYDEDIADGMDAVNAFPCGRATAIVGGLAPVSEVAKTSGGPDLTLQNKEYYWISRALGRTCGLLRECTEAYEMLSEKLAKLAKETGDGRD